MKAAHGRRGAGGRGFGSGRARAEGAAGGLEAEQELREVEGGWVRKKTRWSAVSVKSWRKPMAGRTRRSRCTQAPVESWR